MAKTAKKRKTLREKVLAANGWYNLSYSEQQKIPWEAHCIAYGLSDTAKLKAAKKYYKSPKAVKRAADAEKKRKERAEKKKLEETQYEKIQVAVIAKFVFWCKFSSNSGYGYGSNENFKWKKLEAVQSDDGKAIGFDVNCQHYWIRPDELVSAIEALEFDKESIKIPNTTANVTITVDVSLPYRNAKEYSAKKGWKTGRISKPKDGVIQLQPSTGDQHSGYKMRFDTKLMEKFAKVANTERKIVEVQEEPQPVAV